jgi:primosomal protein N'
MEMGAIDIVVGTQLITKGYHFPQPHAGGGD